jgi:hypothetical protein
MNFKRGKDQDGRMGEYEISECLRYTVCRVGSARGYRYEAWFGKENLAVDFMQAEPAREHCRVHAAQLAKAVA